jgi:hypothetical protein
MAFHAQTFFIGLVAILLLVSFVAAYVTCL